MYASKRLEVILKLTEVCNIACSYCYYFFTGDERPAQRPANIQSETICGLISFINKSFEDGQITHVQIDLHGGEPLMYGHRRFSQLCEQLRAELKPPLRLCLTTNAMLVDDKWIDLFAKYDIGLCVSVDGPAPVHDLKRIDKKGRGTHKRVMDGINKLSDAHANGKIGKFAVLCVVNPNSNPDEIYDYLIKTVGARHLDFLMPDQTYNDADNEEKIALYMRRMINRWLKDDDREVMVRTFNSVLTLLAHGKSHLAGFGSKPPLVMTVGSDGTIDFDDFLKPCGVDVIETSFNIKNASFDKVFYSNKAHVLAGSIGAIPDDCLACEFSGVCRGGQATHRFSKENLFNNKSVYCKAQFEMFTAGARHLVNSGVQPERIAEMCLRH